MSEKEIIKCNMCGAVLDMWDRLGDFKIEKELGYGSKHDGEHIRLHLCCSCMDSIIDSCKITPVVE